MMIARFLGLFGLLVQVACASQITAYTVAKTTVTIGAEAGTATVNLIDSYDKTQEQVILDSGKTQGKPRTVIEADLTAFREKLTKTRAAQELYYILLKDTRDAIEVAEKITVKRQVDWPVLLHSVLDAATRLKNAIADLGVQIPTALDQILRLLGGTP